MVFEHDKAWVFLCRHVTEGGRPVKVVVHERDDDWQVLCGGVDHDGDDCVMYCAACALDKFPEFAAYKDLEKGWRAELINGTWEMGFDA